MGNINGGWLPNMSWVGDTNEQVDMCSGGRYWGEVWYIF